MRRQRIYVEGYGWELTVMYDVRPDDVREVRQELQGMGCDGVPLEEACRHLSESVMDRGVTYTNMSLRRTVGCGGRASSDGELMNTLAHELMHAVAHVAEYWHIGMDTEEACYLMGGLMQGCWEEIEGVLRKI